MLLSLSSFFASFIAVVLLTLVLLIFLRNDYLIKHLGLRCLSFLASLILIRGLLPIELLYFPFSLTRTIYSRTWLPFFRDMLLHPLLKTDSFSLTLAGILSCVWLAGSLVILFHKLLGYRRCCRLTKLFPQISDPAVIRIFENVQEDIFPGGKVSFRLVRCSRFPTPALWGVRHPVVLLPDIDYTEDELRCVFIHELLHYKLCHFLLKILLDLLTIVQWWNPVLIFFFLPAVHQIQELSTDAQLVRMTTQSQRSAYLSGLHKTLQYAKTKARFPQNIHFGLLPNRKKALIFQRFNYIKAAPARHNSILGVILCFVLFMLSFTFVLETSYPVRMDEAGDEIYRSPAKGTFYIHNGDKYELYMDNQYVYTSAEVLDSFKDIPIYDNTKEE